MPINYFLAHLHLLATHSLARSLNASIDLRATVHACTLIQRMLCERDVCVLSVGQEEATSPGATTGATSSACVGGGAAAAAGGGGASASGTRVDFFDLERPDYSNEIAEEAFMGPAARPLHYR